MIVAAVIVLLIAALLVIAALFGGGGSATLDLGSFNLEGTTSIMFFLGMATLLLVVLGLGMLRSGIRRARAHRAERRELGELSTKLDAYKRAEKGDGADADTDERR